MGLWCDPFEGEPTHEKMLADKINCILYLQSNYILFFKLYFLVYWRFKHGFEVQFAGFFFVRPHKNWSASERHVCMILTVHRYLIKLGWENLTFFFGRLLWGPGRPPSAVWLRSTNTMQNGRRRIGTTRVASSTASNVTKGQMGWEARSNLYKHTCRCI
jgi:hypothetical protein